MIHLHQSLLLRMFSERIKDDCRLSAADLKPCDRFSRSSEMWLDLISFFIEPSGPLFTLQIILFSPCGLQVALFADSCLPTCPWLLCWWFSWPPGHKPQICASPLGRLAELHSYVCLSVVLTTFPDFGLSRFSFCH